jgi:hypothetical protein
MIKLHPYENIYFNSIAGRSMQDIKQQFEMDYWGLSYRKGLEYIVQHDSSTVISIFPANFPGFLNFKILPETQQKRLKLEKKLEQADYFITSYRWHKEPYDYPNEVYSIEIDGAKIMSVFKLKPVGGK